MHIDTRKTHPKLTLLSGKWVRMKSKFNKVCLICGLVSGIWGTIAVPTALAGKPAKEPRARPTAAIVDVALSDQATLTGRLTTPDGTPLNQRIVTLSSGTTVLKTTKSDSNGYFVFDAVSAGSLAVASDDCSQHLRVWTKASAPPIAQSEAKLVCGPTVVRGQFGNTIGGLTAPSIHPAQYLRHPATAFGVIGMAIAAPLAIHEEIDDVPATPLYSPSLSFLPQYPIRITPPTPPPP